MRVFWLVQRHTARIISVDSVARELLLNILWCENAFRLFRVFKRQHQRYTKRHYIYINIVRKKHKHIGEVVVCFWSKIMYLTDEKKTIDSIELLSSTV